MVKWGLRGILKKDTLEEKYNSNRFPCVVKLRKGTEEYWQVKGLLASARGALLSDADIASIVRVQNRGLVERFRALRGSMPEQATEMVLFHPILPDDVARIARRGYNRSFVLEAPWGQGDCFFNRPQDVLEVILSFQRQRLQNLAGEGSDGAPRGPPPESPCMMVSRVLVGREIEGLPDECVPPWGFDTFVDNEEDPRAYVATQDCQAIAEYIVTFSDDFFAPKASDAPLQGQHMLRQSAPAAPQHNPRYGTPFATYVPPPLAANAGTFTPPESAQTSVRVDMYVPKTFWRPGTATRR